MASSRSSSSASSRMAKATAVRPRGASRRQDPADARRDPPRVEDRADGLRRSRRRGSAGPRCASRCAASVRAVRARASRRSTSSSRVLRVSSSGATAARWAEGPGVRRTPRAQALLEHRRRTPCEAVASGRAVDERAAPWRAPAGPSPRARPPSHNDPATSPAATTVPRRSKPTSMSVLVDRFFARRAACRASRTPRGRASCAASPRPPQERGAPEPGHGEPDGAAQQRRPPAGARR